MEHIAICGAQIMTIVIVAPLGVMSLAANSLAVTAESLCYMPGYGIADAATTLVGQSVGARQKELAKSFHDDGNAGNGNYRYINVHPGTTNHRHNDTCGGSKRSWSHGSSHRSVCRADVCRFHCSIRSFRRSGGHYHPMHHEFPEHLGSPADSGGTAGPDIWPQGRMDSNVRGAVFQRIDIPGKIRTRQMVKNKTNNSWI